ncbi:MAG: hypothetical protein Q4G59_01580 [Planctomycetia bacterium]|nr:hypothetical protein [Planctomycetia bacterium]
MNNNRNMNPDQWNEYRLRRLAIQRQAVRRVKYTLLAIALLAGCWFLFLMWKEARLAQYEPARIEMIAPAQSESSLPVASQSTTLPSAMPTPTAAVATDINRTEVVPNNEVPVPSAPDSRQIKPPEHDKNGKALPRTPGASKPSH